MQKQIDEVMGLVDALCDIQRQIEAEDRCGANYIRANELIESNKETRASIESKLRELLPVWQPIETAPKGGTEFLSLVDGVPYLAFYDELGRFIRVTHSSREGFGRTWRIKEIDGREWRTLISEGESARYEKNQIVWSDGFNFEPSHWMPLQKAPE